MARWDFIGQPESNASEGFALQFADVMADNSQKPAEPSRTEFATGEQTVRGGAYRVSGNATLNAWGNTDVIATGNANVNSGDNAVIQATDHSKVHAGGSAKITAKGSADILVFGKATVYASDDATVQALGNAVVHASGKTKVKAFENSTIYASGNADVEAACTGTEGCTVILSDGARLVKRTGNVRVRMVARFW